MFTLTLQGQKLDIKHICHHINQNLAAPSLILTFLCMVQVAFSSTDVENAKAVLYQLPVTPCTKCLPSRNLMILVFW